MLIEATNRLGGKIQTVRRDGFVIERGPETSSSERKAWIRLRKDLASAMISCAMRQDKRISLSRPLHPIPGGSVMGIPTKVGPFLKSDLFSLAGKLRAAGDFVLPRSGVKGDQSLGHFFRRRFGPEIVENLIEPLLSGVYAAISII